MQELNVIMPTLSPERIAALLSPYLIQLIDNKEVVSVLSDYLDLLLKWNAKTNLTAIREPEEIVSRHFGESLFAGGVLGRYLAPESSLLDFGSGAGFPGIPIQIAAPMFHVTLAESHNKKAAFLREAVRTLGLKSEVWADRVESMPANRTFDCVAMRAVDNMTGAIAAALPRLAPGGYLALLMGTDEVELPGLVEVGVWPMPGTLRSRIRILQAPGESVPRGTL